MSLPPNCRRVTPAESLLGAQLLESTSPTPNFLIYNPAFLPLLGPSPSISLKLEKPHPFAHEAAIYLPDQEAVYITSNRLPTPDGEGEIHVGRLSRSSPTDPDWTYEKLSTAIANGNGGINYPSSGGLLFCDQGSKSSPGGLVLMDPTPPHATRTLISHFHGRLFSSINDVAVHSDGGIWFTDPIYGFEQGFRNEPELPCLVWRFDPDTREIRAVAEGFGRANGICFSPGEEVVYVTDTDWIHGDGSRDLRRASHIYAFDVIERHGSQFLANRRLFAMADQGIPDGIKCDLQGNVYSGCGDGISVWNAGGRLLGKIRIPGGVANFCFGRKGEIFVLNETRFWVVQISKDVQGALLANMKIEV